MSHHDLPENREPPHVPCPSCQSATGTEDTEVRCLPDDMRLARYYLRRCPWCGATFGFEADAQQQVTFVETLSGGHVRRDRSAD